MNHWQVAPILGVSAVAAAVDFFCEKLGFERPQRLYGGPGEPPVYAIVKRDGVSVHLQIRDAVAVQRGIHDSDVMFTVGQVDALAAQFAGQGVKFLRGVQDEPYGMRDFTIETPDGHRLLFAQPL
jgi:catechol 2,3-dioxygenase-like lactoylglutathione lyase family enzyme